MTPNLNWKYLTLTRFFWKKIRAHPKNNTCCFCCFSKKTTSQKTRFFPSGRNFRDLFSKKRPKIADRGPPSNKNILAQISSKKCGLTRNFDTDPRYRDFMAFSRKNILCKLFFTKYGAKIGKKAKKNKKYGKTQKIGEKHKKSSILRLNETNVLKLYCK